MDNVIERLIVGNNKYQWKILQGEENIELDHNFPKFPLLILTCMDSRIDVHRIFQLNNGDAFVLRNAGNQYSEDVLRSILITIHEYNIKHIIVLGHLDCGMRKIGLEELRSKLNASILNQIGQKSTNFQYALQKFFKTFADEISNINNQVDRLKIMKGIPSNIDVVGMLYDPFTGWVYTENEFKNYSSSKNFMLNYQKLLRKKRMNHIDFLETIESEIIATSPNKTESISEKPDVVDFLDEIDEEEKDISLKTDSKKEYEFKNIQKILEKNTEVIEKSINTFSNIQIPRIYIPKIRVYVPKVNKYNKEK